MSEFIRPYGSQPENPLEVTKTHSAFIKEIDGIFTEHFDDVDRGIIWDGKLPEKLELEVGENGPYFTLVRSIHTKKGSYTDYGLHMGEDTSSAYVDSLYRIKSGLGVHKFYPSYEQSGEIIFEGRMHDFAANSDYENINEQQASYDDVKRTLDLAKIAKPPPKSFQDIIIAHRTSLYDNSEEENRDDEDEDYPIDYEDDDDYQDDDSSEDDYEKNVEVYTEMAVRYFNSSVDSFMDDNADTVKKYGHTEELRLEVEGKNEKIAIDVSRTKHEEDVSDRSIIITDELTTGQKTLVFFQVKEGALQSSMMSNQTDENSMHAFVDPNAARNLFKFINNPRIN